MKCSMYSALWQSGFYMSWGYLRYSANVAMWSRLSYILIWGTPSLLWTIFMSRKCAVSPDCSLTMDIGFSSSPSASSINEGYIKQYTQPHFQAVSCNSSSSVLLNHYRTLRTKQRHRSKASGFRDIAIKEAQQAHTYWHRWHIVTAALAVASCIVVFHETLIICVYRRSVLSHGS